MVITFSPLVHLATGHPKSELDDWFHNHIIRPYVLDTKVKSGAKLSTNQNQVVRGCSPIRGPDLQDLQFPPPAELWQHSEGDWGHEVWMDGVQSVSPIAEATELSCGCKVVGVISLKKEPYRVSLVSLWHSTGTSRPSRMQIRQWLK